MNLPKRTKCNKKCETALDMITKDKIADGSFPGVKELIKWISNIVYYIILTVVAWWISYIVPNPVVSKSSIPTTYSNCIPKFIKIVLNSPKYLPKCQLNAISYHLSILTW